MKVKMLETVQGNGINGKLIHDDIDVTILNKDDEVEVSEELGAWLLQHRKAEAYSPQVKKHVTKETKPAFDPAELKSEVDTDEPMMTTKTISTRKKKSGEE